MIWSFGSSIQLQKLIILQKRFIRIISNANYLCHTDALFYSLNLLKVTDIGQIQTLTFMYKYHHGVLPTTFVNYFCKVADVHSYLTRQSSSLHISYARTNQRKNTIKIIGPKLWNKQWYVIRDLYVIPDHLKYLNRESKQKLLTVICLSIQRCSTWYLYLYSSTTRVHIPGTCTRTWSYFLNSCK